MIQKLSFSCFPFPNEQDRSSRTISRWNPKPYPARAEACAVRRNRNAAPRNRWSSRKRLAIPAATQCTPHITPQGRNLRPITATVSAKRCITITPRSTKIARSPIGVSSPLRLVPVWDCRRQPARSSRSCPVRCRRRLASVVGVYPARTRACFSHRCSACSVPDPRAQLKLTLP